MEFLNVSHNTFLVLMSCLIALVAGFTGLSLTRSLASKPMFEKGINRACLGRFGRGHLGDAFCCDAGPADANPVLL